jgi:hypothetical protein
MIVAPGGFKSTAQGNKPGLNGLGRKNANIYGVSLCQLLRYRIQVFGIFGLSHLNLRSIAVDEDLRLNEAVLV